MSRVLYIYTTRHHETGEDLPHRETQVYLTEPAGAGSLLMLRGIAHVVTNVSKCPGDIPDVLVVAHKMSEHYIVPIKEQVI